MKKILLFLAVASTTMFVSCSDDDKKGGSGEPAATSIVLAANVATIEVGQSVTLTVTDNNANVVTSSSTFFANDVEISGSTFTPTAGGTFAIKATYKNTDDVVLTSNVVTVVVTEVPVEEPNSIFVNGQNYSLDNSILVFYGGYAEDPNATVATHGFFSMITFDGDDNAAAQNYIDVEFIVAVDSEGALVFPNSTNAEYFDIYEARVGGTAIDFTSQEGGTITLEDFPKAINMPHAFSATANYNAGSSLSVDFDGNWLGFSDQSAKPAAKSSKTKVIKMSSLTSTKVLSKGALAKMKASVKAQIFAKK